MLGTRTKQVFAYGKRGHRIVNVTEDRERLHKFEYITDEPQHSSPKSEVPQHARKKAAARTKKERTSLKGGKSSDVDAPVHVRHPLGQFPLNVPGSPAVPVAPPVKKKRKTPIGKGAPFKHLSPVIDVDIVVVDHQGRRLSQERRISKTDVQVNPLAASPSKPAHLDIAVSKKLGRARPKPGVSSGRGKGTCPAKGSVRSRPIAISSDESETDEDMTTTCRKIPSLHLSPEVEELSVAALRPHRSGRQIIISPDTSLSTVQATPPVASTSRAAHPAPLPPPAPVFVQWTAQENMTKQFATTFSSPALHRAKPRQLTPLRARAGRPAIFPEPPSPPSPTVSTDSDLSFDFSNMVLSPTLRDEIKGIGAYAPEQPAYLKPLLDECAQTSPHEFSAFIDMFPFDPLIHGESSAVRSPTKFRKIGEASYSEVFGIGDVVLKIIPLRDEGRAPSSRPIEDDIDTPAPSDAQDVLKEIIVTRAMGDMCSGFVRLLRTYIVRGKYPSLLLALWDEYNEKKGSESARPDSFAVSQVYAIIVLPNGGPDLEAYTFENPSRTGWRQACSLFWQVTRALAEAEAIVSFEHRDLHWGQILVKNTMVPANRARHHAAKLSMDDAHHGVEATIIDLGLARMDAADSNGPETYWTPFDEEIFEGEGDYQFDVYRMMRVHNGDSWNHFRPLTNVMWLHYLSLKLLKSKRLRPPATSKKAATATVSSMFGERDCYECLVEIESLLHHRVAVCAAPAFRKGRRKTHATTKVPELPELKSAADVLRIAIERRWIL